MTYKFVNYLWDDAAASNSILLTGSFTAQIS